jgi:hypothetical protein
MVDGDIIISENNFLEEISSILLIIGAMLLAFLLGACLYYVYPTRIFSQRDEE